LGVELQRLSELATPEAGEILARALSVDDDNVRLQAVRALSASANPGSIDALKRIAQEDRSEVLRAQALEALATISSLSSGELRGMLNDATNDPSPIVRELAQSLREALESPLDPVLRGEDD
jgi:HEAT repeat protein